MQIPRFVRNDPGWFCHGLAVVVAATKIKTLDPRFNHSTLEGESARQGRSPQPRRWGELHRPNEGSVWGVEHLSGRLPDRLRNRRAPQHSRNFFFPLLGVEP